ncbi:MAG TPA: adenylate/guanylate cyclase domain-containing protein [Spirochaetota bacterium]|nr:adenylate/guanylate cyclase domain-containing protein [Spirochaetota bacterium]
MKKKYNKEHDKNKLSSCRIFYVFIIGFFLLSCVLFGLIGFKWIMSNVQLSGNNQIVEPLLKSMEHIYVLVSFVLFMAVSLIMLPFAKKKGLDIKRQRSKRLFYSPLLSAGFLLVVWAVPLFYLVYFVVLNKSFDFVIAGMFLSLILICLGVSSISFVICDYLVARIFIPRFVDNSDVNSCSSAFLPGLIFKSIMLFISTIVVPSAILMQYIYNISIGSKNIEAFDGIKTYYIIFLVVTSVLYALIVKYHRGLILSMTNVITKMVRGDYSGRNLITSSDEVGFLAEIINNSVISLKEKEFIKDTFGDMVDPVVRNFLLKGSLNLEGDKVFVTLMVVDICNYTDTVSDLKAEDQITYLNIFFDRMSGLIESTGGLVNKFIADSLLAVFGAPVSNGKHSNIALECADNLRDYLITLNRELSEKNLPLIDYSIGLHTGEVIAGNVGSKSRMQYTITGKSVNTAFGISQIAQMYRVPVLLSKSTYSDLDNSDDLNLRYVDCVKLKGETEPVTVYEYFESDKEKNKKHKKRYLSEYNKGIEYYRDGKFNEALKCFLYCHEEMPWDYLSAMYIKRCNKLIKKPPTNWSSVAIINR